MSWGAYQLFTMYRKCVNPKLEQPQTALGQAIRELRKEQGTTLKQLAPKAGVTFGTLALIERGESNPTWGTVRGIAKALEVSVAELAKRAGKLDGEDISKADPESRNQGIGFRIGDAFPADNPIARWATVLSMATNNAIYLNVRIIEGDLPPEQNLYYFRLIGGHFFEIATWLKETRKTWPQIDGFVESLNSKAQQRYDNIVAFASQKHPLHKRLGESRSTLFHYPTMHPEREAAGVEELANAMREAADAKSWIEGGDDYATFRASFADEIALQFLATSDEETEEIMEALHDPVFELVELTEAVLLAYLKTLPKDATVFWEKGHLRPGLPGTSERRLES